jgi:tetratricopeptide (TPR) repeat protein
MDEIIPKIEFESEVYKRLEKYLSEHPDDDVFNIEQDGPDYKTEIEGDEPKFFLICAHRQFDPENGFTYLTIADAFLANELFGEARKTYLALKQTGFEFMEFYDDPDFHLGWLGADLENYEQAARHFEMCLDKLKGAHNRMAPYIAMLYHKSGKFKEAASYYDQYLKNLGVKGGVTATAIKILREDAANECVFRGKFEWPLSTCGLEELNNYKYPINQSARSDLPLKNGGKSGG